MDGKILYTLGSEEELLLYERTNPDDLKERIRKIKEKYGSRLLILGHLYERDEIIEMSDLRGDSFQLSASAAKSDCEIIVFCGVHFMAETADILANRPDLLKKRQGRRVDVILPDPTAGCAMANMATLSEVEDCWKQLSGLLDISTVIPVTYVNSTAELKAFCGRNGGIACTSTNARSVLEWSFSKGKRVLFFPDQHLGRNTALQMGIPESEQILWNHSNPALLEELRILNEPAPIMKTPFLGGNTKEEILGSRIILWNGFCPVHQHFTNHAVNRVRKEYPNGKILVHPECKQSVVHAADGAGSTSMILNEIAAGGADKEWIVGTEYHLVHRAMKEYPDRIIHNLSDKPEICPTMDKITLPKLCWALECLDRNKPVPVVRVPDAVSEDALVCLERMLACKS
ncbi:MAG: quinolinate synthase NadA [Planctomycetia bacterium]|nr:quinolinate synthase NadA [Planctomycetia bacterium]